MPPGTDATEHALSPTAFPTVVSGPDARRTRATSTLVGASMLGVLTRALAGSTSPGLGAFVLVVVLVVVDFVAFGRDPATGRPRPTAWSVAAGSATILVALAGVLHASAWSLAWSVPCTFVGLALLPFVVAARPGTRDLPTLPGGLARRLVRTFFHAPEAMVETVMLPREAVGESAERAKAPVLGLLLGMPITFVVVLLLASDPSFGAALRRLVPSGSGTFVNVVASATLAVVYAFAFSLVSGRRDVERSTSAPVAPGPYRNPEGDLPPPATAHVPVPAPAKPLVSTSMWIPVLAQLVVAFGAFLAVNVRSFFGGHAFARAAGTGTYASHVHAGFAQLFVATVISVVTVLAGHRLTATAEERASGRFRAGKALRVLESTLLVFTAVTLVSSWQRLHVYETAYGTTYLRLLVHVVEVAVLGVIALVLVKANARAWRGFVASALAWATIVAFAAAWFDADGWVARGNVDRAYAVVTGNADPYAWKEFDLTYLGSLSSDASPVLRHPYFDRAPEARSWLASRWADERAGRAAEGWRAARGIR
ncbi:MAG: DUF4173 domain-containing protein [Polyangiaceae bacterium]